MDGEKGFRDPLECLGFHRSTPFFKRTGTARNYVPAFEKDTNSDKLLYRSQTRSRTREQIIFSEMSKSAAVGIEKKSFADTVEIKARLILFRNHETRPILAKYRMKDKEIRQNTANPN